jgi:preprotein translocase subunit SecF
MALRPHFIHLRRYWYALSLLVILPGLVALLWHKVHDGRFLNWGIDFTGGSLIELRFHRAVELPEIRNVLARYGLEAAEVRQSGPADFLIRTRELTEEEGRAIIGDLDRQLGGATLLRNERVGAKIGSELAAKALTALFLGLILMGIYITVRFEFKQGVAAVVALLHDVLVTVGLLALFWIPVDSSFVPAILTVIGYSINDTIIIFDRIRENMRHIRKGETLEDVVNASLWQTLARSINTVLTVLFMLLALYFLGGSTLRHFILTMLIGVVSGCYSSICNASPVWVDLKLRERRRPQVRPARA